MSGDALIVSTPARLHFGLLRFGDPHGLSYGGLGMMVHAPRTVVRLRRSSSWKCTGPSSNLVLAIAKRASASASASGAECFEIEVSEAAPRHRGFGSGTQLALAVAAGARRLLGQQPKDAASLAGAAGRARRSAIGTHGFLHGGLLWELSKAPSQPIAPLDTRAAVPDSWRILLCQPRSRAGRHGADESAVFARVPPVPAAVSERLEALATEEILPAAKASDFERFASHLGLYGETAGSCFRKIQGGPFANEQVADVVTAARTAGGKGVGQTSWGPTVFAFAENPAAAETIAERLTRAVPDGSVTVAITRPDNHGATFSKRETA